MKQFADLRADGAREYAQRFIDEFVPQFDEYCGLSAVRGPVLHWAEGELPDLSLPGLHLVSGDVEFSDITDLGLTQWVLIAGDLRCRTLKTGAWFFVIGTFTAELLEGASGCNQLFYATRATVGAVIEHGHSIVVEESLTCTTIFSDFGLVTEQGESVKRPTTPEGERFMQLRSEPLNR